MRVAVLVRSFPTVSETFILRQVTGLLDRGHDVRIFAMERDDTSPIHAAVERYALLDRVRFVDAPAVSGYWEQPIRPLLGKTWVDGASEPVSNLARAVRALPPLGRCVVTAPRSTREVLSVREYGYQAESLSAMYRLAALASAEGGYDVAHAHYGPVGDSFRFARRLWKAALVVSFHGYDMSRWPRENGAGAYAKLFRDADRITVHSEHGRRRVEALGCPPAKVRMVPNAVDLDDFPFRARKRDESEPLRILTVGRLVEKKGIEYSLRAVARLRERHPDVRYEIVGEGPLRARLEALIGELGLGGHAELLGARTETEVRELMRRAHVFVLTSVTASDGDEEGTPVSLLEAQATGLPVVSTRHAGIPEIVADGESGYLVEERDAEATAARLRDLADRPESWESMGRAGRRLIERAFAAERSLDMLEGVYAEAVPS